MISRIDHVAVAVEDFKEADKFFRSVLGAIPGSEGGDEELKFFWRIFSLGDLSRIEILSPTGDGSFLDNFLKRNKQGGVHHITLQTPSMAQTIEALERLGVPYFGHKEKGSNWKELFIHPKDAFGVLIQIAEFRPDEWLDKSVNLPEGRKWLIERKDEKFVMHLAHPGGGKVSVHFEREQMVQILNDIRKVIEQA